MNCNLKTKKCSKCGAVKLLNLFYKDGNGFRSECKECTKVKVKIYRVKNLETSRKRCEDYRKTHREQLINYLKQYRKRNKEVLKLKRKEKHLNNPEIRYQRDKIYRKTHYIEVKTRYKNWMQTPSGKASFACMRHKRLSHLNKTECTLTSKQWAKILEMQNYCCAHCGEKFSESLKPTRDHIIPLSLGGGLTFGNVQALCRSCNSKKKNRFDISKSLERVFNDYIFYMKVGNGGYLLCDFTSI